MFSGLFCVRCNRPRAQTSFRFQGSSRRHRHSERHPRLTSQQQQSASINRLIRSRGSFTEMTVPLRRNRGDIRICVCVPWLLVRPAPPRRCPRPPAWVRVSGRINALQLRKAQRFLCSRVRWPAEPNEVSGRGENSEKVSPNNP